MQRSASPDITDLASMSSEQRRPGRPKKGPSTAGSKSESPVSETSEKGEPPKRGRGRPKRNVDSVTTHAAATPPPTTPTQTSPASTSSPNQQQGKRRGRKPKSGLKESKETDIAPPVVPEDSALDASLTADANETLPNQLDQTLQLGGGPTETWTSIKNESPIPVPMETETSPPVATGSSLFSSVLKSESAFGGNGGIPGLDLDDSEANIGLFGSAVSTTTIPSPSFAFSSCLSSDTENKIFLQTPVVPKQEEEAKTNEPGEETKKEEEENEGGKVRRSSRIKTLEEQRGSRGRRREVVSSLADTSGLSRSTSSLQEDDSNSNSSFHTNSYGGSSSGYSSPTREGGSSFTNSMPNMSSLSSLSSSDSNKPLKVKSRWRYSLDAESMKSINSASEHMTSGLDLLSGLATSGNSMPAPTVLSLIPPDKLVRRKGHLAFDGTDEELLEKLKKFDGIDESIFRTERKISKENKGMLCDCYLSKEDEQNGELGCGEDCLNRLLMVECGNKCPTGDSCSNKRFQKKEYAALDVFKTEKKGHGLRTLQYIPAGGFVIEYVGEVLDVPLFEKRTSEYAKGNQEHFYFMALKSDAIIDATLRGNCSRFINHSCEPNCETQKWTVNGEVRIGFFAISDLQPGDEITFDYQFQRYGKKAQKCFCMTESCRGWIGEEEDDGEPIDEKEDDVVTEMETEVSTEEGRKVKPKPKLDKKKKKSVQLEDMGFREELHKLETSGLKNRNHTLTLNRLMVRAESWDDRERLLKILIKGDTPCRRLFLDYHGLRLIWSWMVDLPLPLESDGPQLIRNDAYHMLFLQALQSLPIPNKNLLLESKVLALVEKWCSVPSVTTSITLVKRTDSISVGITSESDSTTTSGNSISTSSPDITGVEKVPEIIDISSDSKEEPTSTVEGMQEVMEEKTWNFVPLSKSLLESWADLKEVFRIPKKERVEQMKEHEREADKGQLKVSSLSSTGNSSYDRDHRNKEFRNRGERRVPVLDSSQPQYHRHPHPSTRMALPPGMTKEDFRKHFEESVKQREEQEVLRRQQDSLVTLHQERCALVGLDPATTPIVDPHGIHYLDPKTVRWMPINVEDPTLPPELLKFVQLSQYPPPSQEAPMEVEPAETPVEPEQAFPPWPLGLPPPPPIPPRTLPTNWKMSVDDEGRCYYYHVRTRVSRWDPPPADYVSSSSSESSESSSEEDVEVEQENTETPTVKKASIQTWRTKLIERNARRMKSGLVQERIISPRGDDEKGSFTKEMVKENKKKVLEEKLARLAMKEAAIVNEDGLPADLGEDHAEEETSKAPAVSGENLEQNLKKLSIRKSSHLKKRRKDKVSASSKSALLKRAKQKRAAPDDTASATNSEDTVESSSPIETELDLTLSQQNFDEEGEGFFTRVPNVPPSSRIAGSTASMEVVIPGLGFDSRDMEAKKKAERMARHAAKKKAHGLHKKVKDKPESGSSSSAIAGTSSGSSTGDKRLSSKEANNLKDAFRNSIATVVVAHLNHYRRDHIKSTEDFKHLARKITHAILLKELKHTRDVTSLEVTDSVKHKTKEYIKKFMARFPQGIYERSPDNPTSK